MALPEYFIQELKMRSDLTDIVSSYVNLKRRGKNMVGLCPFHSEKTGSFNLYPENGSFYCFGCGAGGDVIGFIMRIENLDYMDAVRFLAQRVGLELPADNVDNSMSILRTRVLEINRETARFFHSNMGMPEGKKGLDYFLGRGLSMQTIKHFGLGYALEGRFSLVNHLKNLKYTDDEMIQADVAIRTKNGNAMDRFFDRAMFPIIDLRGNVVAFGGRRMDDSLKEVAKYINTKDTPVYHKGSGLFAMNFAKNTGAQQLILAEGYMDVISLHAAGFTNTIASLGTALTTEQARMIARYKKEIIICYDSDEAGKKATQRAIPILRDAGLLVKVLTVPGNKDPDEFIKSNGKDGAVKFKALVEGCGNDVEYRLESLKRSYNLATNDGKVQYMTEACGVLSGLDNEIERDVYIGKLSGELDIDRNAILTQVKKEWSKKRRKREKKEFTTTNQNLSAVNNRINPDKVKNLRVANAEEGLITYLFNNPDGIDYVKNKLPPEKFCTAFGKRVYNFILGKNIYGNAMSLTDFSADFTPQELGELSGILAKRHVAGVTKVDADEYISIILNESGFSSAEKIRDAGDEEIRDFLKILGQQKK